MPHCGNGSGRITNQLMTLHAPPPSPLCPPLTPPSPPFCYCDLSHFDRRLLRRDCCMTNCSQLWQNVARTTTISLSFFFFFGQDGSHKKCKKNQIRLENNCKARKKNRNLQCDYRIKPLRLQLTCKLFN